MYLGRELEQKRGLTFHRVPHRGNYKLSAECPCLGRNERSIILIHVGDLIFTGGSKYINENFLPKVQDKFDTRVSNNEKMGDEFNFLKK